MAKKPYNFRLDEEKVVKPLKFIAEKQHRDLTNLIEFILIEYIKKSKDK